MKQSSESSELADLPLFAPKPLTPPPKSTGPSRWRKLATWLPLLGLVLFLAGVALLIPLGMDEPGVFLPPNRTLPTVVVDAGHGGHDGGAFRNGLREKDLALDTALRLERQLRARGFPVVLTRRDDTFVELFDRAQVANAIPRALFVSIHFNDNTTAAGDGVETFYATDKVAASSEGWSLAGMFKRRHEPPPADNGFAFAQCVQGAVVVGLDITDRGAKARDLAVVRYTRCAAVLVEGGFLNNPREAKKLAQPAYRERLATAIAEGVAAYQREREADAQAEKRTKS